MNEKLKYALVFAFLINSAVVLTNFQERTYDSYEHIFFADHYRRSWFDTWEPKWYGGFSVTSYPPLAHQTIALLSFFVGLEWAYKLLTLFLLTVFPLAIYKFSKIFVTEKAAEYAAIVSVFLPSILQAAYSWGQFTTIFGLTLTAIATSLPELLTTIQTQREDEDKMTIGNLLGSSLFNLLFIGGLVNILGGSMRLPVVEVMFLIVSAVFLFGVVTFYKGKNVPKWVGLLLILIFLFYTYVVSFTSR